LLGPVEKWQVRQLCASLEQHCHTEVTVCTSESSQIALKGIEALEKTVSALVE